MKFTLAQLNKFSFPYSFSEDMNLSDDLEGIEDILKVLELHKNLLKNTKTGAAIPHLNKKVFNRILITLPPLNEQKRIVQKIDETLSFVNKYYTVFKTVIFV